MSRILRPAFLLAIALLPSCGGQPGGPDVPAAIVRDSAGLVIVENPAAAGETLLPWRLGEAPLLDVGTLDGPETHQLFQVRSARRLADDRVVVADGGSGELRFFSADGAYLESWGGPGEGPGEFRQIAGLFLWPTGDTLGVWDGRLRRLTLFGPDGSLGRTLAFPEIAGVSSPSLTHVLPDGGLVLRGIRFEFEDSQEIVRPPIHAVVVEADGTLRDTLGALPGSEAVIRISGQGVNIIRVPFARTSVTEVVGDRVVFTPNDRWELRVHGSDGSLQRLIRVATPTRPVIEADLAAHIEAAVARAPEPARPGLRATLTDAPSPDSMPAFQRIVGDALGNAWVRSYRPDFEDGPARWLVFDPEGQLLGAMQIPGNLTIYEIGPDFILGRATDELDVEHVQLWALER